MVLQLSFLDLQIKTDMENIFHTGSGITKTVAKKAGVVLHNIGSGGITFATIEIPVQTKIDDF